MKKLTIACLAAFSLAALSGTGAHALTSDFKDIPGTSPYLPYISDLKKLGVVEGVSEGVFGPEQTLTRAQFAKFVAVAFQLKDPGGSSPFADLKDHWSAAYVRAAFKAGIVNGTSATTFSPNMPVKREEAAVMVWRLAKKAGLSPGAAPSFAEKPAAWATEGVGGILVHDWHGVDAKQNAGLWAYRPHASMTRQEASALIDLAMKDIPGSLSGAADPNPAQSGNGVSAGSASGAANPTPPQPANGASAGLASSAANPTPPKPGNGVSAGLASGTVPYGSMVLLGAAKPGATIYYTTDGSDPRTSSTRKHYASPIKVLNQLQLKTCAVYHSASGSVEVSQVAAFQYKTAAAVSASAGLYDPLDNFKQLYKRANIYVETNHPTYFGNDAKRIARTSTAPGSVIYHTAYDITSFQTSSYFFTGVAIEKNRFYASKDGKTYTEVAINAYPVGNPAGDWQQYAYEASSLPAGTRYLKIELRGAVKSWSPQLSKVLINRSTASVGVKTARSAGALQVELTSASQGARIYYRKDNGLKFEPYSQPLKLTGYSVLEVYAVKDGKEPSPIRKYKLNGSSDFAVDAFGQVAAANFPEKVTSDQQLKADAAADAAYYGGLHPAANLDRYGGLAGSAAKYGMKGTGYFDVQQLGSRKVMKTPDGDLFFSLGMNGIHADETYTMVKGREDQFESIPAYEGAYKPAFITPDHGSFSFYMANKYKKTGAFPTASSFYAEAVGRLKKWGFNSAGGYSPEQYGKANNFPYTRMLPLDLNWNKLDGISIFDIFAPGAEAKIDQAFKQALPANKDDRMLIGYFMGNEYDFHKFYDNVPKLKASSAAIKGRLVKMLKDKYQKIDAFNASWGTSFASFNDMLEAELPVSTSASWKDMDTFFRYYLDTFYGTVSRIFHKYDPNHLLLGDRWITTSFHNAKFRDVMAEVEGKYTDVISINYYSYKIEADLLKDVYDKSGGKPILMSEFGYGTAEQGLAPLLPNAAVNQFQRGMRYRNYVEGVAGLGYVVGAHYFNYVDQAALGRYWQGIGDWAEHYNSGILNVADRPYKSFLDGVMQSNNDIYKVLLGERPKFYYDFNTQ